MAHARRAAFLVGVAISARAEIAMAGEPSRPVHVAVALTRAPGAEHCVAPDALVTKTRARAAADTLLTLDRRGADFVIVGRVEPRGEGFRATLVLRDAVGRPLGERTLDSPSRSCRALDDSLILALVLLVETPRVRAAALGKVDDDFDELLPPLEPERHPDVRTAPVLLPPSSRGVAPDSPAQGWGVTFGLGASVPIGLLPHATVGPTVFAMVRPPHFIALAVRGTAYPFGVDRVTVPGEGITLRGFDGGVELCPLDVSNTDVAFVACTGAHVATLHAEPLGPQSSAGNLTFLVLPLRAELRARGVLGLSALEPYAAATARFAPSSPGFVYRLSTGDGQQTQQDQTSFRVPWATLELELGLAWRFFE